VPGEGVGTEIKNSLEGEETVPEKRRKRKKTFSGKLFGKKIYFLRAGLSHNRRTQRRLPYQRRGGGGNSKKKRSF